MLMATTQWVALGELVRRDAGQESMGIVRRVDVGEEDPEARRSVVKMLARPSARMIGVARKGLVALREQAGEDAAGARSHWNCCARRQPAGYSTDTKRLARPRSLWSTTSIPPRPTANRHTTSPTDGEADACPGRLE
eukprot:CAMPEP_0117536486 /NCGR_PEP_ID=MMETSP0784-20121206/41478_1 /TAXON_ID=39447 /ORGANISM="" /LENGTH=136 /DNA_ID=CAMNT_0005333051 /DNA_START=198 /DNA_END=605 /DNA_ORIENTATION=+